MGKLLKTRVYFADTEGSATVWSIFWTVIFLILAGLAIDMSNAYRYRAALQATADSSSVGAMMAYREYPYYVDFMNGSASALPAFRGNETAKSLAANNMTISRNGTVTSDAQITWGRWIAATNNTPARFVAETSPGVTPLGPVDAVQVEALRTSGNSNALPTLLLNTFGGLQSWNVGATSIAQAYFADCFTQQGIFAMGTLDFSSNNEFVDQTCYHGEQGVDMQNHNVFGSEAIVSAPNDNLLSGPGDFASITDPSRNPGLANAWTNLEYGSLGPIRDFERILAAITQRSDIYGVVNGNDPSTGTSFHSEDLDMFIPNFLKRDSGVDSDNDGENDLYVDTSFLTTPLNVHPQTGEYRSGTVHVYSNTNQFTRQIERTDSNGNLVTQPLEPGTIHIVPTCSGSGGQPIRMRENQYFHEVAIITTCKVHLSSNVTLSRSLLATTNGKAKEDYVEGDPQYIGSSAITGSSGVQIGGGTCNDDNGSIVMAAGGANFSSGLGFMRSQIIVKGDINIAANGNGLNGTSIMAGGDVKLTSNGAVGHCPDQGMDDAFVYYDYRIVQ